MSHQNPHGGARRARGPARKRSAGVRPVLGHSYILFNKPYGVLSQFTPTEGKAGLASFGPFPRGIYPAGRLDWDSEGLLVLTDDGMLKHRLIDPRFGHWRTYLVQVERIPEEKALRDLAQGVLLRSRKTLPANVRLLLTEPELPPRPVPIRYRKTVPTAWLEVALREGQNRQVRRMTAAVGHPALRLIRTAIGPLQLGSMKPGEWRELTPPEVAALKRELGVRQ